MTHQELALAIAWWHESTEAARLTMLESLRYRGRPVTVHQAWITFGPQQEMRTIHREVSGMKPD